MISKLTPWTCSSLNCDRPDSEPYDPKSWQFYDKHNGLNVSAKLRNLYNEFIDVLMNETQIRRETLLE